VSRELTRRGRTAHLLLQEDVHRHDGEVAEVGGLLRRVGVSGLQMKGKVERVRNGKKAQKYGSSHLSVRLELVPHLPEVLGEERLRDGFAVDANALPNGNEMRRSVKSNLRLRRDGGEEGRDESAGRSLALGTGDVKDVEAVEVVGLFVDEGKKGGRSARRLALGHSAAAHRVSNPLQVLDLLLQLSVPALSAALANGFDDSRIRLETVQRVDCFGVGTVRGGGAHSGVSWDVASEASEHQESKERVGKSWLCPRPRLARKAA
jgi:hypothetical protein